MKTLGNILWFLLVGLWMAIVYFLAGLVLCITIIGIPFGKQLFKIAKLYIWPFGTVVETHFDSHPVLNVLWIILLGWETALGFLITGVILCITIIGIPFGKQCFKLANLSLIPFGADIKKSA